jgi:hypothetical protein
VTAYERVTHALGLLDQATTSPGRINAAPVGPDRDIHEARLARDHAGVVHLLVALPPGRKPFELPLGEVLPAEWLEQPLDDGSLTSLDIASRDPTLTPTFLSLVGEMLSRVDESGEPCIDALMRVLNAWRAALARGQRGLSRQRAIGLFGELTVLFRLAQLDPPRARAAWRGQEGYKHDFFLRNALEVKAYTGGDSPAVDIHGAHQLDPPPGASLHLFAIRLEESADGQTVSELIDSIDASGLPKGMLFERSTDDSPIVSENTMRFVVASERLFRVTPEFPGLRVATLGETAFSAVQNLRYSLLLDACPDEVDPSRLADVLVDL